MRQIIIFTAFLFLACRIFALPSVAFFYGKHPPLNMLKAFDVAVVHPFPSIDPKIYNTNTHQLFAYVTTGEVDRFSPISKKINKKWILAENKIWDADVMDASNPQWQHFFINEIITPLWQKGYRGFFLDTLDSYQIAAKTQDEKLKQEQGLIQIIKSIKEKYPQAKLIFNRGFEILPATHQYAYAVAAESLFAGWNQETKTYGPVPLKERKWLLKRLQLVKSKYHLPIIAIDYLPPSKRKEARVVADKILKLGFIPWVTNGAINYLGVGAITVIPRKILILYNKEKYDDTMYTSVFENLTPVLEYLGYRPVLWNVNKNLPDGILTGQYAGVICWLNGDYHNNNNSINSWLLKQIHSGLKTVIFNLGRLNLTPSLIQQLHLTYNPTSLTPQSISITHKTKLIDFEIPARPSIYKFKALTLKGGSPQLTLKDNYGNKEDAVAYTSWGGYTLYPYAVTKLPNNSYRWIINPLTFLQKALQRPKMPMPDTTTENGLRLLFVHVDGDAFISKAEWLNGPYAGEVLLNKILMKYQIPTTVSVIESEIDNPKYSVKKIGQLESIVKNIFKLPWVEIGNHSYTHPFLWKTAEAKPHDLKVRLPIDYNFTLKREISGSTDFFNKLAPKGKKTKVYQWTGDTNPSNKAVKMSHEKGLLNINGGGAETRKENTSLTTLQPLGIDRGDYYQVFAPNQNENDYTNLWQGPYYGFRRVIETFELTNKPYRFKPINIYYHFYSATKKASLKALDTVYDWALAQPTMNVFTSDYIKIVLNFLNTVVAKTPNGWEITNNHSLRELRAPKSLGYPNIAKSKNVVGFSPFEKDYYIHLGPKPKTLLVFSQTKPSEPYIYQSNGFVTRYERTNKKTLIELKAYVPLNLTLANVKSCNVTDKDGHIRAISQNKSLSIFKLSKKNDVITIQC